MLAATEIPILIAISALHPQPLLIVSVSSRTSNNYKFLQPLLVVTANIKKLVILIRVIVNDIIS